MCLLIAGLTITGCSTKLSPTDYFNEFNSFQSASYIESNHNGVTYKLQYRPVEFQALNALKGTGNVNADAIQTQIDSFADRQLYCLRIQVDSADEDILRHNLSDEGEYYHRLELLNNKFGVMTWGLSGQDTVHTGFHHFERTYKIRPFVQVLFSLNDKDGNMPDKLVFEDYIFNHGEPIVFQNIRAYNNRLPKLGL